MIPKILHFIWIGKSCPKYILENISQFSHMNLDFQVNFVCQTDYDCLDNSDAIYIKDCIDNSTGMYLDTIRYYQRIGRKKSQILSNVLRYELLNKYGGIYLDGDCIPIKPFDNKILSTSFIVSRMYSPACIRRDCYFMGKENNHTKWQHYINADAIDLYDPITPSKVVLNRYMLKKHAYGITSSFYIAHCNMEEWKYG